MSNSSRRHPDRSAEPAESVDRRKTEPRLLFLVELEIAGNIAVAAEAAGCTARDVARWRASDPKFARDFVLAIIAHIRRLERTVQDLANCGKTASIRFDARRLLESENQFRDSAGRLDACAWAQTLQSCIRSAGRQTGSWEGPEATSVA